MEYIGVGFVLVMILFFAVKYATRLFYTLDAKLHQSENEEIIEMFDFNSQKPILYLVPSLNDEENIVPLHQKHRHGTAERPYDWAEDMKSIAPKKVFGFTVPFQSVRNRINRYNDWY